MPYFGGRFLEEKRGQMKLHGEKKNLMEEFSAKKVHKR